MTKKRSSFEPLTEAEIAALRKVHLLMKMYDISGTFVSFDNFSEAEFDTHYYRYISFRNFCKNQYPDIWKRCPKWSTLSDFAALLPRSEAIENYVKSQFQRPYRFYFVLRYQPSAKTYDKIRAYDTIDQVEKKLQRIIDDVIAFSEID